MARLLAALLLAIALSGQAAWAALPPAVQQALKSNGIPQQAVAVVTLPLDGGQPTIRHQAEAAMNPASLMKLVTTFAALEILGPAHAWRTEALAATPPTDGVLAGDLYLRGSGDPKLTYDRLWLLLRDLRDRGLREIRGDLVLDRTAFAPAAHDPAAFDGKPLRPYNVGPDALLFNFATLHLTLRPDANGGNAVKVFGEPLPSGLDIVNRLQLTTEAVCDGEWRERLEARFAPGQIILAGPFPRACGEKRWHLAGLPNAVMLHGVFTRLWRELGGEFSGRFREGATPADAATLATSESPALSELVRDINKHSNNVMARQLFLSLGRQVGEGPPRADAPPVGGSEPGLRARGANFVNAGGTAPHGATSGLDTASADAAIRAWLAQKGLDFPELVIDNGAGLSRRARIAAGSLARLLAAGWSSPVMPEYMASLPIAAIDGTVKKKFNGNGVAGRAHLKTGLIEGVRGIAGYLLDRQGRRHVVVFMVNHAQAAAAQPAFDALLEWLWRGDS